MTVPASPSATRFYGLLYVQGRNDTHVNLKAAGQDALDVYIACASLTAQSAARCGEDFTLVTNRPDDIAAALERLGLPSVATVGVDFDLDVPSDIRFSQAHHKLSVIKAFGEGRLGPRVALVDIDVVFQQPMPADLGADGFDVYDLSAAIEPGDLESLERLGGLRGATRWFGGEFIAGPAALFARLSQKIEALLPAYFGNLASFSHVGDETLVSAALNQLAAEGVPLRDAGPAGLVARWWSARTLWRQPAFSEIEQARILHLPADKPFLARAAANPALAADFRRHYRSELTKKLLLRHGFTLLERLAGRRGKIVPRLGTGVL